MIKEGDIFTTSNNSLIGRLAKKLMRPKTDRFHFGLIFLELKDDYITLESVEKGIAIGRLSFYDPDDLKFYRVDCPDDMRIQAPIDLTEYGRSKYDYLLIFKIVIQGFLTVIKNFFKGEGIHAIRAEDLTWVWDDKFICTEAVAQAYNMSGFNIIPWGVCPTPSAFEQARIDGRIKEIDSRRSQANL